MIGVIYMKEIIDKENLFCDEHKASILCEYDRELDLIKQLIYVAEEGLKGNKPDNTWSFDGVCYHFARTIVEYSKMAYDNILLGHFHATHMINRAILENTVFLDIIMNNTEHELWKYYLAYSYRNTICNSRAMSKQSINDSLMECYTYLNISKDFYEKQPGEDEAYICKPYGWTYKINRKFTFKGVCQSIENIADYHVFRLMSDYSHGTALHTKFDGSIMVDQMMSMFVNLYDELKRMIMLFCFDKVDGSFYDIIDELEEIFYRFINYEEDDFGDIDYFE